MTVDPFTPMAGYDDLYGFDVAEPDLPDGITVPPRRRFCWTATDLIAEEFPEPRWAVPGLLCEGLNLFCGAPKLGKSWAALGLSVAVASGGVAFGRIPVDQGDALYLALEDTGRRLQSRLASILGSDPAPERLVISTECPTLDQGGAERVDRWLTGHPDARLVVVDVWARIRPALARNAAAYDSDYLGLCQLKNIADQHGVALVAVHHTRKAAAEDHVDTVSGTHGLAGASDAILILTRARGAAGAVLKVTGRDVPEADYALDFDATAGAWTLLDVPASSVGLGDTRRRILELLETHGPMAPKAISERLGITGPSARQSAKRMFDDGQLDSDGTLYFPVTPVTRHGCDGPGVTRDGCDTDTAVTDAA